MTGEMSQFDADHGEEWTLHRSIARALKGKVRAFDVYQGPYISPPEGGRLWICPNETIHGYQLVYERAGYPIQASMAFGYRQVRKGCALARNLVSFTTAAHRLRDKGEARHVLP